ncbi:MAG: hypothetical protein LLF83_11310 [Methanobacterium sp.]|nr:hypothetical protein [Methanobacterium sp.]
MSKPQVETWRIYITIFVGLGWLLALALWLIFYAGNLSILQNIGVFILSVVLVAIIVVLLWVPWSFKHME